MKSPEESDTKDQSEEKDEEEEYDDHGQGYYEEPLYGCGGY